MSLFDRVIHGSGDSACADHALGNLGAGSSAPLPLGESGAGSVAGGSEHRVSACLDAPDRDGAELPASTAREDRHAGRDVGRILLLSGVSPWTDWPLMGHEGPGHPS